MDDKKTCENCFWISRDGYCTEGGRPPQRYKDACDKYTPIEHISTK